MNYQQLIKERRSIRSFTDAYVTDEQLHEAMEAVRWTPSWANSQCWEFIAIRDNALIKQLVEECYPKNPAHKCSLDASLLLVACYNKTKSGFYKGHSWNDIGTWGMFDLGMACQTLSLKLHDMGLASVIVGAFDISRASELLGVSGNYQLASIMPVGVPTSIPSAPGRREVKDFLHINTFASKA